LEQYKMYLDRIKEIKIQESIDKLNLGRSKGATIKERSEKWLEWLSDHRTNSYGKRMMSPETAEPFQEKHQTALERKPYNAPSHKTTLPN